MYNKIFKFDQITYGRPYQIKVPVKSNGIVAPDIPEVEETEHEAELLSASDDIIKKAKHESELIIKEADCEAKRIISKAREEAEKEAKRQQEEAWQKGYAEGSEAAKTQYEALLTEAEEVKRRSIDERSNMLAGMEKDILELVINVARKVVAAELTVNREIVLQLLRDALNDCSSKESAAIKVSPEDYDVLNENMEEIMSIAGTSDGIEIKKDVSMKKGDIIVDTKLGGINAGIQTKLDKIEESFKELSGGN